MLYFNLLNCVTILMLKKKDFCVLNFFCTINMNQKQKGGAGTPMIFYQIFPVCPLTSHLDSGAG